MPVAVKAIAVFTPTVGSTGLTWIAVSVPAVTVSVAMPVAPMKLAVMVAVPALTPVATPPMIVATVGALDIQVTDNVTSWWVPSLSVASAVKLTLVPAGVVAVSGRIAIAVTVALLTLIVAVAVRPPSVAVIIAIPGPTAVTTPPVLTLAMLAAEVENIERAVTSPLVPSV